MIVVSGAHIAFLEITISFAPKAIQTFILALYAFLVGLQPPVVRALLRRWLSPSLERSFAMTNLQIEASTIVVALLIYPPWIISRSFLMSWMCGLALSAPRPKFLPRIFEQALLCYLFLLPFCWAAPISILWNTLVAPVVGAVLLPARMLTALIHFLSWLTDYLWKIFIFIIEQGPQTPPLLVFVDSKLLICLPLLTHFVLLIAEVKWRRAYAFS